jgi:hypothetical protein
MEKTLAEIVRIDEVAAVEPNQLAAAAKMQG